MVCFLTKHRAIISRHDTKYNDIELKGLKHGAKLINLVNLCGTQRAMKSVSHILSFVTNNDLFNNFEENKSINFYQDPRLFLIYVAKRRFLQYS